MIVHWEQVAQDSFVGTVAGTDAYMRVKVSNGRFLIRHRAQSRRGRLVPPELDFTVVDTAIEAKRVAEQCMVDRLENRYSPQDDENLKELQAAFIS